MLANNPSAQPEFSAIPAPPQDFDARLAHASALVEQRLEELIRAEKPVPNLHEGLIYSLGLDISDAAKRGKRIRPVLCLLTAECLGAPLERAMPFALAIELMHNFALVHDDMEDGDVKRRDRDCTYIKYGAAHGINIGDYLFCKVLTALLGAPAAGLTPQASLDLIRLMSETLDHTHIGQALDISARKRRDMVLDDYYCLVREKTGYYLAAPMLGGALTAGAGEEVLQPLAALGQFMGPMFQIQDDLIDLTDEKGRGEIGSDIREGKRSFCVIWASSRMDAVDAGRFWDILDRDRQDKSKEEILWVISLFRRLGALDAAKAECERLRREALQTIASLPHVLQPIMGGFLDKLAKRKK